MATKGKPHLSAPQIATKMITPNATAPPSRHRSTILRLFILPSYHTPRPLRSGTSRRQTMPDLGSTSFSQTDGSNTPAGSDAPNTIDNNIRANMGALTREWNWRSYTLTAGGTANAKTLTYSVTPAAYYNGQRFAFIANTTNTGNATLNVNSIGAKNLRKLVAGSLTALASGDMVAGQYVEVAFNTAGDCFTWVNQGAGLLSTANTFTAGQNIVLPAVNATLYLNSSGGSGKNWGVLSTTTGDIRFYNQTDDRSSFQVSSTGQISAVVPGGTIMYAGFMARAWVQFNGTGAIAISASGNVSSIGDNGAGNYTVNFTTAMPDANYAVVSSEGWNLTAGTANGGPTSTTAAYLGVFDGADNTNKDSNVVNVAVFR